MKETDKLYPYIKNNLEHNTMMLLRRQDFIKGFKAAEDRVAKAIIMVLITKYKWKVEDASRAAMDIWNEIKLLSH